MDTKIKQDTSWLPLGQRLLQSQIKTITPQRVAVLLGIPKSCCANVEINKRYGQSKCERGYRLRNIELNKYLKPIPDKALQLISNAYKLGLQEMYVVWAEKKKPIIDPIVVAWWNDNWWYITYWEATI